MLLNYWDTALYRLETTATYTGLLYVSIRQFSAFHHLNLINIMPLLHHMHNIFIQVTKIVSNKFARILKMFANLISFIAVIENS